MSALNIQTIWKAAAGAGLALALAGCEKPEFVEESAQVKHAKTQLSIKQQHSQELMSGKTDKLTVAFYVKDEVIEGTGLRTASKACLVVSALDVPDIAEHKLMDQDPCTPIDTKGLNSLTKTMGQKLVHRVAAYSADSPAEATYHMQQTPITVEGNIAYLPEFNMACDISSHTNEYTIFHGGSIFKGDFDNGYGYNIREAHIDGCQEPPAIDNPFVAKRLAYLKAQLK